MRHLTVTGYGNSWDEALTFADNVAAEHFGPETRIIRRTRRPRVEDHSQAEPRWSVTCEFRSTP